VQSAGEALDDGKEFEGAERLADEGIAAGRTPCGFGVAVRAREQHDGDVLHARVVLDAAAELDAVHPGHPHVQDDDVRSLPFQHAGGRGCVVGLLEIYVDSFERRAQ
jgi:hypothetical protein